MKSKTETISVDQLPMNIAQYRVDGDGDFIIVDLNAMALETEKVSKGEILGRKVTEVFPAIVEVGLLDVFERVYRSGKSERLDLDCHRDGHLPGLRRNTVSRLDKETIMAVYEYVDAREGLASQVERKVSELRAVTEEYVDITRDLQKAQRLAKIGSWRYDIVEDELIWSDEAYRIFQIDKSTHPIKRADDLLKKVDPIYTGIVTKEYARHLREGVPSEFIHELRFDDGSSKWLQERWETLYDEYARPVESNGILQDITQQKRLEDELLKDKKLLEDAQLLAHVGSWEWDIKAGTLVWSDEVYKIFGEKVGVFVVDPERFYSFIYADDLPAVQEAVSRSLEEKEQYKIIHRILRRDGSIRYVQETGTPYYDDNGEPVSMIGSVLDITDMHNIRLELERKREELQKSFDVNPNIIIITDGNDIIDANDKFLLFTGFDSLEAFKKEYRCICDLFEDSVDHISSEMDGQNWVSYVIEHDEQVHKALIRRDDSEFVFSIHADSYRSNGEYRNIVVLEDITKIEQAVYRDYLTALYNRKKMSMLLMDLYQFFVRYDRVFSVIMLDIDDFKIVNDTFGHDSGDEVLKEIAKSMSMMVRDADFVGRWGGEEFLIVCPETSEIGASKLAEEIRAAIAKIDFEHIGNRTVTLGVNSIKSGMSVEGLVKGADEALYDAKEGGKNRVVCYSSRT